MFSTQQAGPSDEALWKTLWLPAASDNHISVKNNLQTASALSTQMCLQNNAEILEWQLPIFEQSNKTALQFKIKIITSTWGNKQERTWS